MDLIEGLHARFEQAETLAVVLDVGAIPFAAGFDAALVPGIKIRRAAARYSRRSSCPKASAARGADMRKL